MKLILSILAVLDGGKAEPPTHLEIPVEKGQREVHLVARLDEDGHVELFHTFTEEK